MLDSFKDLSASNQDNLAGKCLLRAKFGAFFHGTESIRKLKRKAIENIQQFPIGQKSREYFVINKPSCLCMKED